MRSTTHPDALKLCAKGRHCWRLTADIRFEGRPIPSAEQTCTICDARRFVDRARAFGAHDPARVLGAGR
jgi:hypothetical protein